MHDRQLWDLLYDVEELLTQQEISREPWRVQPRMTREQQLEQLAREIASCRRCSLSEGRHCSVPGQGPVDPEVMVVGEAPGSQEDQQGLPFVGAAGQYLDKWLAAIQLDRRSNVFIGNIIKCRPPNNRDPLPAEQDACLPYLKAQTALLKPKSILCVGRIAAQIMLGSSDGIGRLRGTIHDYSGIPLVATYHPSGVLRNPEYRRPVWDDLRLLRTLLDRQTHA